MSQLARGVLTRRPTNPPIRQSRKRWVDENATAWWLQARVPGRTIRSNVSKTCLITSNAKFANLTGLWGRGVRSAHPCRACRCRRQRMQGWTPA